MAEFISPLGRIVQGDAFKGQTTNQKGEPLLTKTGPNAGKPRTNFFLAIAFPKMVNGARNAEFDQLYMQLVAEAKRGYPQHFDAAGNCTHPRMTFKVMDGDGIDNDGKPNSSKDGFAGHWVLKCSSSFAPKCFFMGKLAPHEQIQDERAIKCGDYVRIMGTIEPNIGSEVPGVYVNHNVVELCYAGTAISSGVDTSALAAMAAPAMPQGASALPAGLVGGGQPALPGATPAPGLPGAQQAAPPLPNNNFTAGAMQLPGTPAPQPVYTMSAEATAGGHTRESLNAAGYSDDVLLANGWMTRQG